jgi:hypothetical protein
MIEECVCVDCYVSIAGKKLEVCFKSLSVHDMIAEHRDAGVERTRATRDDKPRQSTGGGRMQFGPILFPHML